MILTDRMLYNVFVAAHAYRAQWLICHENNPRSPQVGDEIQLGFARGRLFAAIGQVALPKDEPA